MAMLFLLHHLSGTLLMPTPAAGTKAEQGFMPCSELYLRINLKENSWMGQRVLTDKNRSENRIGLQVLAQGRASTFCPAELSATAS